jgi:hypothetical protein
MCAFGDVTRWPVDPKLAINSTAMTGDVVSCSQNRSLHAHGLRLA